MPWGRSVGLEGGREGEREGGREGKMKEYINHDHYEKKLTVHNNDTFRPLRVVCFTHRENLRNVADRPLHTNTHILMHTLTDLSDEANPWPVIVSLIAEVLKVNHRGHSSDIPPFLWCRQIYNVNLPATFE